MPKSIKRESGSISVRVPKALSSLIGLAGNLWWAWDAEASALWQRVDPQLWERTGHNPVAMLRRVSRQRWRQLAADREFVREVQKVQRRMQAYMKASSLRPKTKGRERAGLVAYFSMEFGLHESLPIYAGGLGILAGDHMKSASDLGLPLVGVGMFWREGYVRQQIDAAGGQADWYERKKPEELPLHPVTGADGRPLKLRVQLGDERIAVCAWRVDVGRVPVFLLDTDLPENPRRHRGLTNRLYVGDRDSRIRQEVVLGIGGWRLLRAMRLPVVGCHLNEGHAAFCCLERLDETMRKEGVSFAKARGRVAATTVFTTHTPVPEGNEVFAQELVEKYVGHYGRRLGIGREGLMEFGFAGWDSRRGGCEKGFSHQQFGMTPLALRLSDHRNGVSKLHGEVSRKMWHGLWPNRKVERVPIGSITNGVHLFTWLHPKMLELLDEYLPKGWNEKQDGRAWAAVQDIPDEALWRTHLAMKAELLDYIRGRLQGSSRRAVGLDPDVLTIGFARRFTAYKRASLVLSDARRLARLVGDSRRPVRIVFAGKSHPADGSGKTLVAEVVKYARSARLRGRVVFLEDYDMAVSRKMIAGVDVWLNTPQRPKEASGTSGMKPAAHGGLNLSILDGWWPEACRDKKNGWAIGKGEDYDGTASASRRDAASLYQRLERDVIPLYYRRGRDGLPGGWVRMMRRALATIPPVFNTHRMVREYWERYYRPVLARG
jgi:starch phosphorylase